MGIGGGAGGRGEFTCTPNIAEDIYRLKLIPEIRNTAENAIRFTTWKLYKTTSKPFRLRMYGGRKEGVFVNFRRLRANVGLLLFWCDDGPTATSNRHRRPQM